MAEAQNLCLALIFLLLVLSYLVMTVKKGLSQNAREYVGRVQPVSFFWRFFLSGMLRKIPDSEKGFAFYRLTA